MGRPYETFTMIIVIARRPKADAAIPWYSETASSLHSS